ncbi:cysteine protease PalB [Hyaloscypha variabilis]
MEAKAQEAELAVERSPTREAALEKAILAAELYMKATKYASSEVERKRLRSKCLQLTSRAESIKKSTSSSWVSVASPEISLQPPVSQRAISKREEIILLEGSKLHGFIFPQWTSDPDDALFAGGDGQPSYIDPVDLKLSDAQSEIFAGWRRPHASGPGDLNPVEHGLGGDETAMAASEDIDLVQDITTDCSVVASLCAGTARARKGHGKLLASIIFPYDHNKARPRVSKSGKYIFRLNFNGCFRRVVIDDRLPASSTSRSLHVIDRNNPHLIWPALVEKAYLKVRGGYDFPGSNSGTDLWVLTGWIPEQIFLQSDDLQPDQLWNRIYKSFGFGDVMITLGTGKLSAREENELGLVGEHDYAVLDMREISSQRLILVKNPWCDGLVWKGSNPIPDPSSSGGWTGDLRKALPNQLILAPGTFWMIFEDIIQHFESLYLNWNPGLFRNRQDVHFSWTIPEMRSPGSFTHNPQYSLSTAVKGTVWILLCRHFVTGEQEIVKAVPDRPPDASGTLGFISLYVFEGDGRRVYLSDDALHRGAFVDSPQTLVRLELTPSTSYTVVVAQHGLPLPKYSFTLSFFSRTQLAIAPAVEGLPHCSIHRGAWTVRTAGGNASAPSYPTNPQFSISVSAATNILLILETDQEELAVHVKMVWAGGQRVTTLTAKDIVGESGDYRRGCALASLSNIDGGTYTIVCSTFEAGQMGNFTLRVGSMVPCKVVPILAETAGRLSLRLPLLIFEEGVDRMLAPLTTSRFTRLRVVVRSGRNAFQSSRSKPLLKVSVERSQGPNKTVLDVSGNGEFSDAPMGIRTPDVDLSPGMSIPGGLWIVVERLGGRHGFDEVEVEVLSDNLVNVGLWGRGDG